MITLDEARKFAIYMRSPFPRDDVHREGAKIIDELIAMVEAPVTDAEVEAALVAYWNTGNETLRDAVRAALEAAAAARSPASGTQAKAAPESGLNREESEP